MATTSSAAFSQQKQALDLPVLPEVEGTHPDKMVMDSFRFVRSL